MPINMGIEQAVWGFCIGRRRSPSWSSGKNMDAWSVVQFAPLFSGILPEDYRRISAVARVQEFTLRDTLYLEGDAVEQVFLLTSGFVKTTQRGPGGTEVTLRVGAPGDVLGAVNLFTSGRHTTTAQALRMGWSSGRHVFSNLRWSRFLLSRRTYFDLLRALASRLPRNETKTFQTGGPAKQVNIKKPPCES